MNFNEVAFEFAAGRVDQLPNRICLKLYFQVIQM